MQFTLAYSLKYWDIYVNKSYNSIKILTLFYMQTRQKVTEILDKAEKTCLNKR